MIDRVVLMFCICIFACQDDTNKPYDIVLSGIVSDQVTKQAIEGATVSCGIIPGLLPGGSLCNSRKLDSVYEIKKIPGNMTHYIQVLKQGGAQFSTAIGYSINLKPDVTNNFNISF
jgi:hypothetical protein